MVLVSGQQSKTLSFGTQSNSIMKYIRWFSYSEEAISLTRSFSLIHTQPRSMGLWAHTFDGIYKTLNLGKFPWFSKEPKIKPLDLEPTGTTSAENKPNFQVPKFSHSTKELLRAYFMPGARILLLFLLKLQKAQLHTNQAEEVIWIFLKISSAKFLLPSAAGTNYSQDRFEGFWKFKTVYFKENALYFSDF